MLAVAPILAQTHRIKNLDSLEAALFSMDKKDTMRILQTGSYIVKHSVSGRQKYTVLQKMAETYFRANNTNKSIEYCFKAKEVAEQNAKPDQMARAYGSLANLYSYLNLTEKARLYLDKAMLQIENLPYGRAHQLKALSYLEMGNLDFNDRNFIAANKNYRLSLKQFDLIKDAININIYSYRRALYNIGNSYYYLNQRDSAESYLERALKVRDDENPNLKYFIFSTLAEVYSVRGEHRRAIDTLQTILKDTGFDIPSLKTEVYLNLSKNYQRIGDEPNYVLYNEKHLSLRDTIQGTTLKAIGKAFKVEQQDYSDAISAWRIYTGWLTTALIVLLVTSGSIMFYLNRNQKLQHIKYLSLSEKLTGHELISIEEGTDEEPESKTIYPVPPTVEAEIRTKLNEFERNEGFRNPKINISMLAVSLGTNPTYLSAVIKKYKLRNFNNYINELRIDYICHKIHTHSELQHVESYGMDYIFEGTDIIVYLSTTDMGVLKYVINDISLGTNHPTVPKTVGIYPNPASDFITVFTDDNTQIKATAVYTLTGQQILQGQFEQLDISSLSSGIYLLKAEGTNGFYFMSKLIKE